MREFIFSKIFLHWKELLGERRYVISLVVSIIFILVALFINFIASKYTDSIPALSVGDLILDNIPLIDLSFFYRTGLFFIIAVIILYPILFQPELLPFTAKTFAAFIIIRSFFITLTHIGAPEPFYALTQMMYESSFVKLFYLNDLFFSGHTGIPFLAALLFWENKVVRYFMLFSSFVMAVTVLFMHVHYSIDVFSAYFITYTIYVISDKIFNKLNLRFRRLVEKVERRIRLIH